VILLDTNVISEMMRPLPSIDVLDWLNQNSSTSLFLSTPTIAEIDFGICVLPNGKRRRALNAGFTRLVTEAFAGRIWTFDVAASRAYGPIMSARQTKGRPISIIDGQIAAIAKCHGASVATRNVRDFDGCGVKVENPFG
jgi:toxin FitB